jgi:glycosyltransferase involved in cell wall biosynthesis
MKDIDISIITPCFNEVDSVFECSESIRNIMKHKLPTLNYEHIFIDNDSTDSTVEKIKEICLKDKNVKLLVNSRNIGAFKSIFKAMKESSGTVVIPMYAADLQDPAEVIPDFYRKWEEGYLVTFGVRNNRKENFILRKTRTLYYKIIQKFSESYIPINAGEFLLADRKVIDSILETKDHEPYIRGMVAISGVKSIEISYNMNQRKKGKSKTNLLKLFDTAINAFIGTSRIPARIMLLLGFTLSALGTLIGLMKLTVGNIFNLYILEKLNLSNVLIIMVGGLQIFFIGLVGEYVLSIHAQVRKNPESFFIKRINFD